MNKVRYFHRLICAEFNVKYETWSNRNWSVMPLNMKWAHFKCQKFGSTEKEPPKQQSAKSGLKSFVGWTNIMKKVKAAKRRILTHQTIMLVKGKLYKRLTYERRTGIRFTLTRRSNIFKEKLGTIYPRLSLSEFHVVQKKKSIF